MNQTHNTNEYQESTNTSSWFQSLKWLINIPSHADNIKQSVQQSWNTYQERCKEEKVKQQRQAAVCHARRLRMCVHILNEERRWAGFQPFCVECMSSKRGRCGSNIECGSGGSKEVNIEDSGASPCETGKLVGRDVRNIGITIHEEGEEEALCASLCRYRGINIRERVDLLNKERRRAGFLPFCVHAASHRNGHCGHENCKSIPIQSSQTVPRRLANDFQDISYNEYYNCLRCHKLSAELSAELYGEDVSRLKRRHTSRVFHPDV